MQSFPDGRVFRAAERQALVDNYFQQESCYWKSVYERNDLTAATLRQRTRRSLKWVSELRLPAGTEILDAGCGPGRTSVTLAAWGYRVQAVDHVPAMVELTHQAAEQANLKDLIQPSLADICSLPQFSDQQFGLVLSLGVIGWLESPQKALKELYRVLKPGGYLILSVGNGWCLQDVLNPPYNPILDPLRRKLMLCLRRLGWLSHAEGSSWPLTHRRNSEIDRMLKDAGLHKIKSATVGFGPFTFFKKNLLSDELSVTLHNRLQSWADRNVPLLRSAGAVYVVLSRKPGDNVSGARPGDCSGSSVNTRSSEAKTHSTVA
jgi:ubiquinone/menaquinone biosynthesis C-methylase UbiE